MKFIRIISKCIKIDKNSIALLSYQIKKISSNREGVAAGENNRGHGAKMEE